MSDTTETKLPEHHSLRFLTLDHAYYTTHTEELEKILLDLNTQFSAVGVLLTVDDHAVLKIDVDEEKYRAVTKRRAGRKKSKTTKQYEEIMEYRKTHTAMETAEWLGLTKQTYYRKLKEHRENGDDGSVEF